MYVLVPQDYSLKKLCKKEDRFASIVHFADRPEVPYEVAFRLKSFGGGQGVRACVHVHVCMHVFFTKSFPQKRQTVSGQVDVFRCVGKLCFALPKRCR